MAPARLLLLGALLVTALVAPPQSPLKEEGRRTLGAGFVRAAHYFGLSRYGWPINYLNTVDLGRLDEDFAQIAADGFTAIVLVVPWGEIQPVLLQPNATYNDTAFTRLDAMIKAAHARGLEVIFRLPYLWAINPDQQLPNMERMNALLSDKQIRATFMEAVRTLDRRLIRPNPNVRFVFATWEDFYLGVIQMPQEVMAPALKQDFSAFARSRHDDATLAKMLGVPFDREAAVPVPRPNAPGWQLFLEFIDVRIAAVTTEMAQALSVPLSYEVRIDADPIVVNGRVTEVVLHYKTYDVSTSDVTTVYYAPYMGQPNRGERLTADEAAGKLREVFDEGVRRFTKNRLFMDQFNVAYNSPGYESHARLADGEIGPFLEQAADYMGKTMFGYGLWGYKDYYSNLLYNPAFQIGTAGWTPQGAVRVGPAGVELQAGAAIVQHVPGSTVMFGGAPRLELCAWASSATGGTLSVSAGAVLPTSFVVNVSRKPAELPHCVAMPTSPADLAVEFRATAGTVVINGAVLHGHKELAGVYDTENQPAQLQPLFVRFNRRLAEAHASRGLAGSAHQP